MRRIRYFVAKRKFQVRFPATSLPEIFYCMQPTGSFKWYRPWLPTTSPSPKLGSQTRSRTNFATRAATWRIWQKMSTRQPVLCWMPLWAELLWALLKDKAVKLEELKSNSAATPGSWFCFQSYLSSCDTMMNENEWLSRLVLNEFTEGAVTTENGIGYLYSYYSKAKRTFCTCV